MELSNIQDYVTDRYAAVRKERLCYGCLGKGHAIKDCKVHPCSINGCNKKHNRLLHSENQMDEGSHVVNVSAATINQSNQVTSFLQIVPVSVQKGGNRLTTYAFLDSGSTVSFIDQSVKDQLQANGTDVTLNIAGIHGTQDLRTEKVPITIKDNIQRCIRSKRLHTHQSRWETRHMTKRN